VGLVALGQTLVLLAGGIDLSVGANATLSTILGALLLTKMGVSPYAVIPLTMAIGFSLGFSSVPTFSRWSHITS
jgi:ribose transport system permease protein